MLLDSSGPKKVSLSEYSQRLGYAPVLPKAAAASTSRSGEQFRLGKPYDRPPSPPEKLITAFTGSPILLANANDAHAPAECPTRKGGSRASGARALAYWTPASILAA